jgi:chromosome segregation ATPase
MLHLAQISKNLISGGMELQLLAEQIAQRNWSVSNSESIPLSDEYNSFSEGVLVLIELDRNRQIRNVKEARDWIVDLVENYLSNSAITPEFIETEQAKVEDWRREIAVQSQDLTRRNLELETRREQLQELEERLQKKENTLQCWEQRLQSLEDNLKQKEEKLRLMAKED